MTNRDGYYDDVDRDRKKARYHENKKLLASLKEGKVCVLCGSDDRLEFDHIDRETKKFSLAQCGVRTTESLLAEAAKCRLLCRKCHWARTHEQHSEKIIAAKKDIEPLLGTLRTCSKCKQTKDLSLFYKNSEKRIQERGAEYARLTQCKDCSSSDAQVKYKKNKEYIESKKEKCVDCGATQSLEFDHVRGEKFKGVAMMKLYTRDRIDEEIAKCEVVCTPCHMRRTENKLSGAGRPRKNTDDVDVVK